MRPHLRIAAIAAVVVSLAAPASAQIISTSLPNMTPGQEGKSVSAHFMITPLAKWNYKEVYLDSGSSVDTDSGLGFEYSDEGAISGGPYSKFMFAGEVAFALGHSDWALTAGGWYNKIGSHDFDLNSYSHGALTLLGLPIFAIDAPLTAKWKLDLDMYEGHIGIFYKSFGVQFGYVRTEPRTTGELSDIQWATVEGAPPGSPEPPSANHSYAPLTATNDWAVHGVFRKSAERWSVSAGLGAYVLKGIPEGSPLRDAYNQTVASAFATGSLRLFGPVGIDVSYWYLGSTAKYKDYKDVLENQPLVCSIVVFDCSDLLVSQPLALPSGINKSRLTLGIGLSF
jgi:hypothetical protein